MTEKPRIIAMIPARRGSTRLKEKNLALLNGKPLISYAIQAAQEARVFERVVINSEDEVFAKIAQRYKAEFYKRPEQLGSSGTKSDDVIADFIRRNPCDILVWVNPTSPLQTGEEVAGVVKYFIDEKLDSLVTIRNEQVHCVYKDKPLNFDPDEIFAQTQDLNPVGFFVYSVMMWRTKTFQEFYEKQGYALLCGRVGYYPVSRLSSIIIKREEDLKVAEYLLAGMEARKNYVLTYDKSRLGGTGRTA